MIMFTTILVPIVQLNLKRNFFITYYLENTNHNLLVI